MVLTQEERDYRLQSVINSCSYAPTAEQMAIIEKALTGDSFKVKAAAGSGKTSTTVLMAKALAHARGLYLAFNRKVADEARPRFPNHVSVLTAHSLAFRAIGKFYDKRLEQSMFAIKHQTAQRFEKAWLGSGGKKSELREAFYATLDTISRFQNSADFDILVDHVPNLHAELDKEHIVRLALGFWAASTDLNHANPIPITHDTYFKLWQLGKPRLPYDVIYTDESQDLSPVMTDVIMRQEHAQRIFVGDEFQQIYAWRGAVNTLGALDLPGLPLTQSFRFGPEVAAVANEILRVREAPFLIEGLGPQGEVCRYGDRRPDVVLARTNAGLVGEALNLVEDGHTISIVGGVDSIISWVEGAYDLYRYNNSRHGAFQYFDNWGDLKEASETDQGRQYRPFVQLVENYRNDTPSVCRKIREAHRPPEEADVELSSLHKYKGQEDDVVRVADDFGEFCEVNENGESREPYIMKEEEANLAYVGVTRAKKVLDLGNYYHTLSASLNNAYELLVSRGVTMDRQGQPLRRPKVPLTVSEAPEAPKMTMI